MKIVGRCKIRTTFWPPFSYNVTPCLGRSLRLLFSLDMVLILTPLGSSSSTRASALILGMGASGVTAVTGGGSEPSSPPASEGSVFVAPAPSFWSSVSSTSGFGSPKLILGICSPVNISGSFAGSSSSSSSSSGSSVGSEKDGF